MTVSLEAKMYDALKIAKYCFDQELRGREVDDKEWERCYAACSSAIVAYDEAQSENKSMSFSQKVRKSASSRR